MTKTSEFQALLQALYLGENNNCSLDWQVRKFSSSPAEQKGGLGLLASFGKHLVLFCRENFAELGDAVKPPLALFTMDGRMGDVDLVMRSLQSLGLICQLCHSGRISVISALELGPSASSGCSLRAVVRNGHWVFAGDKKSSDMMGF